jgi:DNA-binding MarR family transcriptional regulator
MSQQLLTRTAEAEPDAEPIALPAELDSAPSKLVFLYLRTAGECTVDELQSALDMKKISLYPLLKTLSKKGLVDRRGEAYTTA